MSLHRVIVANGARCDRTVTGEQLLSWADSAYDAGHIERKATSERDARALLEDAGLAEFSRFVHDALHEARRQMIVATAAGVSALGDFEPLPTGDELRAYWLERLPEGERRVLEAILRGYPAPVDRERISAATEYKRSSRDTYIQRLSARRLIVTGLAGGAVRASEELFG